MSYTPLTEFLFDTLGLKGEAMWPRSEKRRQKVSTCGSFSYRAISETPKEYLKSTVSGVFGLRYNSTCPWMRWPDSLVRQLLLLREYERMSL
jgi:hypothetical protein